MSPPPPPPLAIHPPPIPLLPNPSYESLGDPHLHPDVLHLLQSMQPPLPPLARIWRPSEQQKWLNDIPKGMVVSLQMECCSKARPNSRLSRRGNTTSSRSRRVSRRRTATTATTTIHTVPPHHHTRIVLHLHPEPNTIRHTPVYPMKRIAATLRTRLTHLGIPSSRRHVRISRSSRSPRSSRRGHWSNCTPPTTTVAPVHTLWPDIARQRIRYACKVTTDTINDLFATLCKSNNTHAFKTTLKMREFLVNGIRQRLRLPDTTPEEDFLAYSPILMVDGGGEALIHQTGIARVHPKEVEDVTFRPISSPTAHMVLLDIGARYGGYCADISRTFVVHPRLNAYQTESQRLLYNAIKEVHDFAVRKMRPGISYTAVQEQVQQRLDTLLTPYAEDLLAPLSSSSSSSSSSSLTTTTLRPPRFFTMPHRLGHTVGAQVHATPSIEALEARHGGTLCEGMILTIEPGVYTERCCVRIENVVEVTKDGGRILSDGCGW